MKKIIEWCSYCEQEVEIQAIKYKAQECPNCKKLIKACSLCDTNKCKCNKCKGGHLYEERRITNKIKKH